MRSALLSLVQDCKAFILEEKQQHQLVPFKPKIQRPSPSSAPSTKESFSRTQQSQKATLPTSANKISAEQETQDIATFDESIKVASTEPMTKSSYSGSEAIFATSSTLSHPTNLKTTPLDTSYFSSIEKTLRKISPGIQLVASLPDDTEARRIAENWKHSSLQAEILLLDFSRHPQEKAFLQHLARAMTISFRETQVLDTATTEANRAWEAILTSSPLKLIIAPPKNSWNTPALLEHLRQVPSSQESFLGKAQLHFCETPDVYLRTPQLKRTLWLHLCQLL